MNLLDRIIGYFSPAEGLRRKVARDVMNSAGYGRHGASYGKKSLAGWISRGLSADEDIVDNIGTLRNRSRDLFMGTPIATGAIKTIRTNVVGSGLALNAQVDAAFLGMSEEEARAWETNTEREWKLWSEGVNCDAERRQNFYQLQSLVLVSALLSGDVFVTLPYIRRKGSVYDLKVSLIEADRICDPQPLPADKNVLGGVEVGEYGETIAYYVAHHNPNSYPRANTLKERQSWKRVLAFGANTGRRNVLHIMADIERPAQRRGVPLLAPVIEAVKQLGRYSEAELMAAVISGMFTVFVHSPDGQPLDTGISPIPGVQVPAAPVQRKTDDIALGNGAIVELRDDEKVSFANPGRPNQAFEGFVIAICRQIGAALEIPYELLVKNFNASYSASRASLLEAWKMFRMRREWLVGQFCQPVYEEWLTEAALKGRIKAPGFFSDPAIRAAWCGAEWYGDSQGQLDPLKEANAAKVRVEEGFSTREREAAELTGMKFETIHAVRKREETMRKADGLSGSIIIRPEREREEDES
jgi:lambda family phage portal protein